MGHESIALNPYLIQIFGLHASEGCGNTGFRFRPAPVNYLGAEFTAETAARNASK